LIQNDNGAWIRGFARNIGFSNILDVELLAMYHGLRLAWELEVPNILCYSDSKITINLIFATVNNWHHYVQIIRNIQELAPDKGLAGPCFAYSKEGKCLCRLFS